MKPLQVSRRSAVPVYRQLVAQLSYLVETGELAAGELLPSAKLLAANLGVNRNTVARAYAELAGAGLVAGRGRGGTAVVGPAAAPDRTARDRARTVLDAAVRECLDLGVGAEEVQGMVAALTARAEQQRLTVVFVECNADRAAYFAEALSGHLGREVGPAVLTDGVLTDGVLADGVPAGADLVLTTFFHLAEVRRLCRGSGAEVVAIVVAPHVRTLARIAAVPKGRAVGIRYSTEDQAASIRDSLTQAGLTDVVVLADGADLAGVHLVVVPSEAPELAADLAGRVEVVEWGNVLDAASVRMVTEVVADVAAAKQAG